MEPNEIRRTERWLATARVFLAITALVAVWMDPDVIGYSPWAYWLVGLYVVHGVVVMMLLRFRRRSTSSFRLLVHAADIVWPALIVLFSSGQNNPFFLFFIFVLAAAAFRWGRWETFATASIAVLILWTQSLVVAKGFVPWFDHMLAHYHLMPLSIDVGPLEPRRLFMRSVYLYVMGLLLGYMAEQQKQLRAEKAAIARILAATRVEAGLSANLHQILVELLNIFGADRALIASQEANSFRVFLGDTRVANGRATPLTWPDTSPTDQEIYLYQSEANACFAVRSGNSFDQLALDGNGKRIYPLASDCLSGLARTYDFRSLVAVSFLFGQEWTGRIFLLNSALEGDKEEELRFLQELVRQVGPAIYNVYLIRRLRLKAGAMERARFARELHDGAVQSLIAVEMQVDVLRRQAASRTVPVGEELNRIQSLLREEVLKLRELMQQMKSFEVDARKLIPFLTDTVERFQRETGITARFVSEPQHVDMSARVCREIARIVQEGLVNVRKHSGATHVLVRLGLRDGFYRISIEDDGRGFQFSGSLSYTQLEESGRGPLVIRERVRLIEGELTIESNPGKGARLEVSVPHKREAVVG
jgi:signal transduction histidine kinase